MAPKTNKKRATPDVSDVESDVNATESVVSSVAPAPSASASDAKPKKKKIKTTKEETKEPMATVEESAPAVEEAETVKTETARAETVKTDDAETKTKGKKAKKDATKKTRKSGNRTPSSYVMFSMEFRKEVIQKFPDLSLGEVSKKCGEAWSALSADVKSEWKAKADALKEEKAALNPKIPSDETKKKRKPSSYLCFSMDYRKKVVESEPNLSLGEVSKRCGSAWKELSDAEKEVWKEKAAAL